jgi:two-component system chemotaxis response regulator CheB
VAIGTSTGGIAALHDILPEFPKTGTYAILIAMHIISPEVVDTTAKRLNELCSLKVKMAEHGMSVEPGAAYIIPSDYHAETKEYGEVVLINLSKDPKVNFVRPSVDVLMKSVAGVFKENSIGILLTGMGMDGARGMKAIKDAGGSTMVQDQDTSSVFQMAEAAIDLSCVDTVLPLEFIPKKTMKWIDEKTSKWAAQI